MCGRTTLVTPGPDLRQAFGLDEVPELPPRYNVAPLHDRMPMIVPPDAHASWLAPGTRASELFDLMTPDATALEPTR
jgi:putative SOS response-associated peptidase YedK